MCAQRGNCRVCGRRVVVPDVNNGSRCGALPQSGITGMSKLLGNFDLWRQWDGGNASRIKAIRKEVFTVLDSRECEMLT